MHEGDSSDGGALIPPAEPSDQPAPPAGTRPPGLLRTLLTYLVVAALSAAVGVGATLTVQRVTAPRPGTAGMTRAAGADRLNGAATLNDEAVYRAVEPGVVDVAANLAYLQETAKGTGFVIDAAAGLILTNNHVINGATSVTITPGATVGEPPCPPSLPMASTGVPTRARAELPIVTALSRGVPRTWSRATSSARS